METMSASWLSPNTAAWFYAKILSRPALAPAATAAASKPHRHKPDFRISDLISGNPIYSVWFLDALVAELVTQIA
jgi:hypothetical protein